MGLGVQAAVATQHQACRLLVYLGVGPVGSVVQRPQHKEPGGGGLPEAYKQPQAGARGADRIAQRGREEDTEQARGDQLKQMEQVISRLIQPTL